MSGRRSSQIALRLVMLVVAAFPVSSCDRTGHNGPHHDGDDHMMEGGHHGDGETSAGKDLSPSGELKDGVRVVEVKARQFEFEPETIVVRKGEKVRLEVTSEDVKHGIAISA